MHLKCYKVCSINFKFWQENNTYKATLIVQHDKELIMPGDGAFDLLCDNNRKDNNGLEMFVFSIDSFFQFDSKVVILSFLFLLFITERDISFILLAQLFLVLKSLLFEKIAFVKISYLGL